MAASLLGGCGKIRVRTKLGEEVPELGSIEASGAPAQLGWIVVEGLLQVLNKLSESVAGVRELRVGEPEGRLRLSGLTALDLQLKSPGQGGDPRGAELPGEESILKEALVPMMKDMSIGSKDVRRKKDDTLLSSAILSERSLM